MDHDRKGDPDQIVQPMFDFPIVGVGASAGGLEAMSTVFATAEADAGMAYVVIQHLDPHHKSLLTELLSRVTDLPVQQIEEGDLVERDNVYIAPPGFMIELRDGRLHLVPLEEPRGVRRPIDEFMRSLAQAQGEMGCGVILSGTGTDGSLGLRTIRSTGGLCIAQDPSTAKYDGMPNAAISTGQLDLILPPDRMLPEISRFFTQSKDRWIIGQSRELYNRLPIICELINEKTGLDFTGYKSPTLLRRIARRMQILHLSKVEDYVDRLRQVDDEAEALIEELLINVTAFFRDPEYFEKLRTEVIEPMVKDPASQNEIRVWVPGCSSGQEPYTIAMLLNEAAREYKYRGRIQVFATDIDRAMIEIAREGRYSAAAIGDLPERFRDSFIIGNTGSFQIAPRIRDMVRFSVHSLIKDPPFSKLDLISCRNLLIYMESDLQDKVIPLFHYALRPDGYLFLGPSEGISKKTELFRALNQKARIFKRVGHNSPLSSGVPLTLFSATSREAKKDKAQRNAGRFEHFDSPNLTAIREAFAPPFVIVDKDGHIHESSGELSVYLQSVHGESKQLIGILARPGLAEVVGEVIETTIARGEGIAMEGIEVTSPFGVQKITLYSRMTADHNVALVFIDDGQFKAQYSSKFVQRTPEDSRSARLENDLSKLRYELRITVEELETANEELKSSNEEMMSMNEELQSANEELETANEELKTKLDEIAIANDDLDNILRSTQLGIVVLDQDARVRVFTNAATAAFRLQAGDVGRQLTDVRSLIDKVDIKSVIDRAINEKKSYVQIVRLENEARYFMMRCLPYKSTSHLDSGGAVIVLNDVSELKLLEASLGLKSERLAFALSGAKIGVWEYAPETQEFISDERLLDLFDVQLSDSHDMEAFFDKVLTEDLAELRSKFEKTVTAGLPFEHQFRVRTQRGETRWIKGLGRRFDSEEGPRLIGVNYDITAQQEASIRQDLLVREMNHRVKNLFAVISALTTITDMESETKPELVSTLKERIAGLGRAYELTQNNRDLRMVSLRSLLVNMFRPVTTDNNVILPDSDLPLPTATLTPLGLILHELLTNAIKYGSLAQPHGYLEIDYSREGKLLTLNWSEHGAKVDGEPDKSGFGSRLITQSLRQLGGDIEFDWKPDGLNIRLTITIRD
ncbi:PAS domain-containing protein [Marivivens donghaensis]|uniref:PAS domain-containing protein n=1 Tax=Marivivens donghaensis TaxID=1699413 RepID=A0ABX0W2Z8_9RHOB|nr:PAS domain-containing protein [Marivivens donghaensis]